MTFIRRPATATPGATNFAGPRADWLTPCDRSATFACTCRGGCDGGRRWPRSCVSSLVEWCVLAPVHHGCAGGRDVQHGLGASGPRDHAGSQRADSRCARRQPAARCLWLSIGAAVVGGAILLFRLSRAAQTGEAAERLAAPDTRPNLFQLNRRTRVVGRQQLAQAQRFANFHVQQVTVLGPPAYRA